MLVSYHNGTRCQNPEDNLNINGTFSTVTSNARMTLNDELERMCKELAIVYFKILSQNLLGGTEENLP
jgi:hypothetical protein